MKRQFYLFRRGNVYYAQNASTGKQQSLQTRDRNEAERLVNAKNEATASPILNIALAKAYLSSQDPQMLTRTWQDVFKEFCSKGQPQTQAFRKRRIANVRLDAIRNKVLIETTPADLVSVLNNSGVLINALLRCVHNLALGMGWLPWPILPSKLWPELKLKPKRGITEDEHKRILAAEQNPERKLFYEFLWETGASQTDAAMLKAENVDWSEKLLNYVRQKTGSLASIRIGARLEELLKKLPNDGAIFPKISQISVNHRSAEFWRRCKILGIKGVSLHSYRYAWAERARKAGYPMRFAQEALGHNSRAIHNAYAKKAQVQVPSLEDYEKNSALTP